jgi:hypothetical protein
MEKSTNVYDLKKGDLLAVKAPPYYKDEYIYEVTSAGEKMVRAALEHSPKVRKSWTAQELQLMIQMGVVRLITPDESL